MTPDARTLTLFQRRLCHFLLACLAYVIGLLSTGIMAMRGWHDMGVGSEWGLVAFWSAILFMLLEFPLLVVMFRYQIPSKLSLQRVVVLGLCAGVVPTAVMVWGWSNRISLPALWSSPGRMWYSIFGISGVSFLWLARHLNRHVGRMGS